MFITEPSDSRYSAFNTGSPEVEVCKFLQLFVELVKPQYILETGTYKGYSSAYMAKGLKENKEGRLETLEIGVHHIKDAKKLWEEMKVSEFIDVHEISSLEFTPTQEYDLIFLDSEPEIRYRELIRFYPYLKPGGFAFIHDLPRGFCKGNVNPDHPEIQDWPYGPVPEQINNWLKNGELVKWHFPTPRDLAGFYKPKPEDYHV